MDKLYRLYFRLPSLKVLGIGGKIVNRSLALILKRFFDHFWVNHLATTAKQGGFGLNTVPRKQKVVVSLTSFPARIETVWVVIELLMRQTYKPDAIVLYLAQSQFPDQKVPDSLTNLISRGLTIKFCAEDLRSHKKYFYTFSDYPDHWVITVDDDLYYDSKLVENLVKMKEKYPSAVAVNRAHKMRFDKVTGSPLPYRKWEHNTSHDRPSNSIVQTGAIGVLYQRNDFIDETFTIELIRELAPNADDLWLYLCARQAGKPMVTNARYTKDPISIKNSQMEKLVSLNVLNGGNDKQFSAILKHFNLDSKVLKD